MENLKNYFDVVIIGAGPAGLLAYELSKYDKSLIEGHYPDILEYCKEYRELCGKNLKIIEKIREIAVKRNDYDILKEIDQMNTI